MAVKTIYEVYDILESDQADHFDIEGIDKDGNDVVISSDENTRKYLTQRYGDRKYPVILGRSADIFDAIDSFYESFRMYLISHWHNINRMYQTLFDYDYNPIENYNRTETETIEAEDSTTYGHAIYEQGTDSTTYGKTDTLSGTDRTNYGKTDTLSGTDRTTITINETEDEDKTDAHTGTETVEHDKAGFNAPYAYTSESRDKTTYNDTRTISDEITSTKSESDSLQHGKVETLGGNDSVTYGKTDTLSGTDSSLKTNNISNSGVDTDNKESERELHAFGNIGVTTNQKMVTEELQVRQKALSDMILDDFVNTYTYYS